MASHRIARHCRCCIVRIELDIETNTHHILKPCTHLTKGTRLNTISQVYWMRHFYRPTNASLIWLIGVSCRNLKEVNLKTQRFLFAFITWIPIHVVYLLVGSTIFTFIHE